MTEDDKIMRKIMSAKSLQAARVSKLGCGADSDMDAKYVRAARESSLARWFAQHSSKPMPVPKVSAEDERRVTLIVDEIIEAKSADPEADTWFLEVQIDYVVHEIYGLTDDETTIIYRSLGLIHQTDEEEDAALGRAIEEALMEEERCDIETAKEILREISEGRDYHPLQPGHTAHKESGIGAKSKP